jgi:hypothetical protein
VATSAFTIEPGGWVSLDTIHVPSSKQTSMIRGRLVLVRISRIANCKPRELPATGEGTFCAATHCYRSIYPAKLSGVSYAKNDIRGTCLPRVGEGGGRQRDRRFGAGAAVPAQLAGEPARSGLSRCL